MIFILACIYWTQSKLDSANHIRLLITFCCSSQYGLIYTFTHHKMTLKNNRFYTYTISYSFMWLHNFVLNYGITMVSLMLILGESRKWRRGRRHRTENGTLWGYLCYRALVTTSTSHYSGKLDLNWGYCPNYLTACLK